jgi:hypothetical protein
LAWDRSFQLGNFNDNVLKVALARGMLAYRDQELALDRDGTLAPVWMNLDYSRSWTRKDSRSA